MNFYIAAFLVICGSSALAKPLTDTEWRAEYGRYGVESIIPYPYTPYTYTTYPEHFRLAYPDMKVWPRVKASYDPEFFYKTYGFYPEH